MPFESKSQAKWMFANKPEMAKEWASKTKNIKKLPVRKNDIPVWEKPDPTKTEDHLSKKKKASAKARAKAAGRPYPNLIDNMAAAKSVKKDDQASLKLSGKLHRVYKEKNGDVVVNHAGTKKQNGSYDKINLTEKAGVKSVKGGVKATINWHKNNPHTDVKKYDSPAWTRSEGKNPNGGLNAKGRASAKAQGHNLKPPVKRGNNPRRASFLARMGNMPGPEHKPNGEPTRLLLSLNAWGASSKADAKKKAAAMKVSKARKLPVNGRWKHLSGKTTPLRIVGQNPTVKDSFDVIDYKDTKRILPRGSIIFTKSKLVASSAPNNPLKLKTTGRVNGHMNMTGIKRLKTPGVYVAKGYDFSMTQSRFGGSSAVGKAFVEPIEKSVVSLVRSGVGQSQKRVAQATQSSTKEWSAGARADMRRRADRAMRGVEGKEIALRPSKLAAIAKPADNVRPAAPRSGRNASKEVAVRPKRTPEFVQSTPLRSVKSNQATFLGMPGMRMPDAQVASSAKKIKPKKQKVKVTTRSYAPEAAAATAIGGTIGYTGYKKVNKAVDEFGNQIPPKSSTLAMAGGIGAAALGSKKFGDARVAPVRTDAAATQAKRNAASNAKRLSDAKVAATFAGANKTKFRGGTELKRAQNNLRVAQNRADISASQAKTAKKAKKIVGLKQRDLRWRGAALLAGGAGLAGMGASMKEKGQ